MSLIFEWNEQKAKANLEKHGVSFAEAATAFGDPLSSTVYDPDHSAGEEDRFVLVGRSHHGRLIVVVHVEKGDRIRLISARRATRSERKDYEES